MKKLLERLFGRQVVRAHDWQRQVSATLNIHPDVFRLTRIAFERTHEQKLEGGLFWYGPRVAGQSTVAAIVIPVQVNRPGSYHVSGEAMELVSDRTRDQGWRNLAQVHTHPGKAVSHSPYDDEQVVSRHALSLVLPDYGATFGDWRKAVGVHEFADGRWQRWDELKVARRIVVSSRCLAPSVIDLRRSR